jgi:hypothetical protein
MGKFSLKSIVAGAAALGIGLSVTLAPAYAAGGFGGRGMGFHSGFGGCGIFPCGGARHGGGWRGNGAWGNAGWHGYGYRGYGWRGGYGNYGWGYPAAAFGLGLLGAYGAYGGYNAYYNGYYANDCTQYRPVYDRWGHYLGRQAIYVC